MDKEYEILSSPKNNTASPSGLVNWVCGCGLDVICCPDAVCGCPPDYGCNCGVWSRTPPINK